MIYHILQQGEVFDKENPPPLGETAGDWRIAFLLARFWRGCRAWLRVELYS